MMQTVKQNHSTPIIAKIHITDNRIFFIYK